MTFEDKVQEAILRLLHPGQRVLVAFSGGPDSTCLLITLLRFWPDVAAVYVNHHLRGEESEHEESFVRSFCENSKITLFVEHLRWKRPPVNLEEEARKRRYRHLAKVAAEHGFHRVALAHHQDDVVETFLLRLMRGAGPGGLAGIPERRGIYIRPMLHCSRREILQTLDKNHVPSFTDSSNENFKMQRNRIRGELLPYIEQHFNPAVRKAFLRSSEWILEQNSLVSYLLEPFDRLIRQDAGKHWIQREDFLQLPVILQKALLRRWVLRLDPLLHPSGAQMQRLLQVIENKENLELSGFLMVESSESGIALCPKSGQVGFYEVDVPAPGKFDFPAASVSLDFSLSEEFRPGESENVAFLDAEKASFPLQIRNWKRGDSFQPLGMAGSKKLSDYWIDRKVSRMQRKRVPLVLKDEELIWVAGHQIDHKYRVTEDSKRILRIELIRNVETSSIDQ